MSTYNTNKPKSVFNISIILILAFTISLTACTPAQKSSTSTKTGKIDQVVLVSIDGLRPDAITKKNAPYLYKLSRSGLYFPKAQTIKRSVTLPSHTSMLTGLDSKKHKIEKNKSLPGYLSHPTVLQMLKKQGMSTASFFSKKKLNYLFEPSSVDYIYGRGLNGVGYHETNASNIATEFARVWQQKKYNFTFIHIREPDSTGHKDGWMSPEYLDQAVAAADQAIGKIQYSIINSPYANNTLLIITADHGGKDKIHWSNRPEDLTIPWMAVHPAIKPTVDKSSNVKIYDTTPTILHLLGVTIPPGLDGKVIPAIENMFH